MAGRSSGGPQRLDAARLKTLVQERVKSYYEHLLGYEIKKVGTSYLTRCPFHDDKSPSFTISQEHGGWSCQSACSETGDIFGAWARIRNVDFKQSLKEIAEWLGDLQPQPAHSKSEARSAWVSHAINDKPTLSKLAKAQKKLQSNKRVLKKLKTQYGITAETAERFKLGWDVAGRRLWIPVFQRGELINIRKHDIIRNHCVWKEEGKLKSYLEPGPNRTPTWSPKDCRPQRSGSKVLSIQGHGGCAMYPTEVLGKPKTSLDETDASGEEWVCITGGELKAIYLNQEGITAVTYTTGEGKYDRASLTSFKGLDVEVCMDADPAGLKGARNIAEALRHHARKIRIVELPYGDVNDYFRSKNWDFSRWPDVPRRDVLSDVERDFKEVRFAELWNPALCGTDVSFRALVVGGGVEDTRFVHDSVVAECGAGKVTGDGCSRCKLPSYGWRFTGKVPLDHLVEIRGLSPKKQRKQLIEEFAGVPTSCPDVEISFGTARVREIALAQDVDPISDFTEDNYGTHSIHRVYFVGSTDIPENEPVVCSGKVVADPANARATVILSKMMPVRRAYEDIVLPDSVSEFLEAMPGGSETVNDVVARVGYIINDIEEHTAHIYNQKKLLLGSLLGWFLPLRFMLSGQINEKVGAEVLIVGDTRGGKSAVNKSLLRLFRAGRYAPCEGASMPGLVGGSAEMGGSRFFTWGVIPSQDGGLVLMDEIDDIAERGVLSQLTSIRSDGIASRSIAGGTRQCSARVRMIMLSNPVNNREMKSYGSVMHAVNSLIGAPQDVARFEWAIGVYTEEDPAVFNRAPSASPALYGGDIAPHHLRWAWRQRPKIEGPVAEEVLKEATRLAGEYKGLVLLIAAEARWKVARAACAVAALCHSHDDAGNVRITKAHVRFAGMWFDQLYGSSEFAFKKFMGSELVESEELINMLKKLGADGIQFLYENDSYTMQTIETLTYDRNVSRTEFLQVMTVAHRCLVHKRNGWIKSQGFKDFLKRWIHREQ